MTDYLVARNVYTVETPRNVNGSARSLLAPRRGVTAHYTGVSRFLSSGAERFPATIDTVDHMRSAVRQDRERGKPWQYNYKIPPRVTTPEVWEYAGAYQAAHSLGNNSTHIGVQFLNGIGQPVTDVQVEAFRWLVWWLDSAGMADPVRITPHREMPGANTSCPGPVLDRWSELTVRWTPPLPTPEPLPTPPVEPPKEPDMNATDPYLWSDPRHAIWWLVIGADVRPIRADEWEDLSTRLPYRVAEHDQFLAAACHRNGLSRGDLPGPRS